MSDARRCSCSASATCCSATMASGRRRWRCCAIDIDAAARTCASSTAARSDCHCCPISKTPQAVILVDAVAADAPPGTLVRLDGDDVGPGGGDAPVAAPGRRRRFARRRALARSRARARLVLLGIVPESIELGVGLSPAVSRALPSWSTSSSMKPAVRISAGPRPAPAPASFDVARSWSRQRHDDDRPAHRDPRHRPGRRLSPVGLPARARARRRRPRAQRRRRRDHRCVRIARRRSTRFMRAARDGAAAGRATIRRAALARHPRRAARHVHDRRAATRAASVAHLDPAGSGDLPGVPGRDLRSARTAAIAIRSPTARTAGRASPSRATCRTTAPATTMARFTMCAACQREYDDPDDRRFHAQPNACPDLRPASRAARPRRARHRRRADPIGAAGARADRRGAIVAIKGLGGFHLACDATSHDAVATAARAQAPRREAVRRHGARTSTRPSGWPMLDDGRARAAARRSSGRSCSCRRRAGCAARAEVVAPDNPLVGLMLPYTPLHHLLLRRRRTAAGHDVRQPQPTSRSPIATTKRSTRLRAHRRSASCCTIARSRRAATTRSRASIAGAPVVLRRSRGYVPRPIARAPPFDAPVLACGALLKNTFCIGVRRQRLPRPAHRRSREPRDATRRSRRRSRAWSGSCASTPEIVAHDLHPDYLSTRYALGAPEPSKVGVQHHHAHVASAMAEHGARRARSSASPTTAPATAPTARRGAARCCSPATTGSSASRRSGRSALAGGDAAIREPWRIALRAARRRVRRRARRSSAPLLRGVPRREMQSIVRQHDRTRACNAPLAHGVGPLLRRASARSSSAAPIARTRGRSRWRGTASPIRASAGRYAFVIDHGRRPWSIDLRPMVRARSSSDLARRAAGASSRRGSTTRSSRRPRLVVASARAPCTATCRSS